MLAAPRGTRAAERSQPSLRHVPALDGLRGLAVAAVLLFHAGHLTGGWLGVDLFLVLSGYLITSLLLVESKRSGSIGLLAFWGRRARRILPALLVVLVVVTAYARFEMTEADRAAVRDDVVATAAFIANWHDVASGSSYFDRTQAPSPLAHTWSLSVEEQLYLLWPLAVVAVAVRARRRDRSAARSVAMVAAGLAMASGGLALVLAAAGVSDDRIYLGTDTRAIALLLGATVAGLRRRPGGLGERWRARLDLVAPAAGLALVGLWWGLDGTSAATYRGGLLVASVLGAVVVAAAADPRSPVLAAALGPAPLRFLGRVSYSAYLWHLPVYVVLDARRTGLDGVALTGLRIAVTLALATVTWTFVEEPVRRRRPAGRWEGRRGAAIAVGSVFAVVAIAVGTTWGAHGLDRGGLEDGTASSSGAPAGAPSVMFVGDSVAASLARAAIDDPASFAVAASRSTVNGCQAVWDGQHRARGVEGDVSMPAACPAGIERLVTDAPPDVVVVAYGGWVDAELEIDGSWRDACDPGYRSLLRTRFGQVLAEAGAGGSHVVAVGAARSTNTYRPEGSDDHIACANAELEAASSAATVPYVDLDAWLCPDGDCRERIDGLPVRSDGVHFQGPGGEYATRWVLDQALELAGVATTEPATPDEGTEEPGERALADACRAYGNLTSVSQGLISGELKAGDVRGVLDESFALLDPATVDALGPDAAAELDGFTDPQMQRDLRHLLDRALAGEHVTPEADLPAGSTDRLDRAFAWLRTRC